MSETSNDDKIIHHPSYEMIIIESHNSICKQIGCDWKDTDVILDDGVDAIKKDCQRCGARTTILLPWDEVADSEFTEFE